MRKKLFTFLLAIVASISPIFAESGTCGDNLIWDYSNGVLTISGIGTMTNYSSTSSAPWASYRSSINTIIINNGVTSIGERAFYGCTNLTSIIIPNGVTTIGKNAFYNCSSLPSISIPKSVVSIESNVFTRCDALKLVHITDLTAWCAIDFASNFANPLTFAHSLYLNNQLVTNLVIPDGVTSIGRNAFYGCTSFTSVTIPNSVTSIGTYAFSGCSSITSIIWDATAELWSTAQPFADYKTQIISMTFGDHITSIPQDCCYGMTVLRNVVIGQSVSSIGNNAFYACSTLNSITWNAKQFAEISSSDASPFSSIKQYITSFVFGNNVESIPSYLCYGMSSLSSVSIPNSVSSIGKYAFASCSGISSIVLPDGITSINDGILSGCTGLTSVSIPNSVTSIGNDAFNGCRNLPSIQIPNNVTSIGNSAFRVCSSLPSIEIPNTVTTIGAYAFASCSSLTSIIIPNGVTTIEKGTFSHCSSLTSVTIPESITSSKSLAFEFCALKSVYITNLAAWCAIEYEGGGYPLYYAHSLYLNNQLVTNLVIPDGVTSIKPLAFYGCTSFTSVTIPNSVVSIGTTSIGTSPFSGCSSITSITWDASAELWSTAQPFADYKTQITSMTFGDHVTDIPQECCKGMSALQNVSFGSNLSSIGNNAFDGCSGLTSITIPNTITSVGTNVFNKCTSLTTLIWDASPEIWSTSSFSNIKTQITSLTFGNSMSVIPQSFCQNMTSLNEVTFKGTVSSIEDHAFDYCVALTSLSLPNTLTRIGEYAFFYCRSLSSISIPNNITSIEDYTFRGCDALTSITFSGNVTNIGTVAFDGCSRLTSIYYDGTLSQWCNNDYSNLMYGWAGGDLYIQNQKLTSLIVPNGLTNIKQGTFIGCHSITTATIPNSVTNIGTDAFAYCTGLSSIIIPESVTSIGDGAFWGCLSLTSVSIPENVTEIGALAFLECSSLTSLEWNAKQCLISEVEGYKSLFYWDYSGYDVRKNITSLTIGANVRSLPEGLCAGMTNLKTITSYAETPPTLGEGVFTNAYSTPKIYVPCNMKQSYQTEDGWSSFVASCYQYAPSPYQLSLRANDYEAGAVAKVSTGNSCEGHVFKATANTGYHFVQWTDGISDNPRTVLLTQDTTFTAEFAKDIYTIYVQANDTRRGTVSDDITAYYQDEVTLTATANYGYHFEYWEKSDNRHYYSNPYTFTVTGSDVYTANFAKNTYYLNYYYDSSKGSVSGSNSGEYLDEITIQAEPNYGYHFVQWSDGVKSNPRTIELTQDTTFRAEFAVDRAGQCGTNKQLTWVYDPSNKILTISGNGSLEYNYTYGVEAPSDMRELVIGNGVTVIGEDAFKDAETLTELSFGENVKTIKDNAFKGCINLRKIYNYRATPTNAYSFAFDEHLDKFDCELYVLASSLEMYKMANVWKDFYYIEPISTTETTVTEDKVTVSPADNTALFTWRMSEDASTYTLQITKDGVIFCTLSFDADGSLKGIAFAPGKDGQAHAPAATLTANGMQFTVTGLNAASKYAYRLAVADAQNNEIIAYSGEFATNGYEGEVNPGGNPEGIDEVPSDQVPNTKVLRNGQIYIIRGDKTYTLQGQEVK